MRSLLFFLLVWLCLLGRLHSSSLRLPFSVFSCGSGSKANKGSSDSAERSGKGSGLLHSRGLFISDGRGSRNGGEEDNECAPSTTATRSLSSRGKGNGLQRLRSLLQLHGGAKGDDRQEEEDITAVDDENEDLFDGDDDDDDDIDDNQQQSQMINSISDLWVKTPPITQAYVGSSIALTLAVFVLNKNVWPEILNLNWGSVVGKFQFWRPFTGFLFFGPLGLNYVLTIQFVWTYMAQLEKLNYNKPEEFFMMLLFGAVTLILGYQGLGFSTQFLGHNLSTFLVYIWARTFEGTDVNVMDLFCLKAELLPWFFCAQTYLLEGEIPYADILGIVVGHLYHYIFLEKKMKTIVPSIVKDFFSSETMRKKYVRFKDDFE